MATPSELVHAVAEVLGVSEATVVVHDRNLVMAGLRTKGGRGRSAPRVTARDAANLLIAVTASSAIKDAAETVRTYSALDQRHLFHLLDKNVPGSKLSAVWSPEFVPIPTLSTLGREHTFGDVLEALILSAADGSLLSLKEAVEREIDFGDANKIFRIGIEVKVPQPWARVTIKKGSSEIEGKDYMRHELLSKHGDLQQTRDFTQTAIFALGDLLAPVG